MNPYLIWIVFLGFCGVGIGAGGFKLGIDHEKAAEMEKKDLVAEAVDAANNASAAAIAALRPKYTTINNEVQHEVRTNTIYNDCHNTADGLRLLNQALSGGAEPSGGSQLPKTLPPK